jgi:hypothetical protein
MELSQQLLSLELAIKLKELGIVQDSYFHWLKICDDWKLFHAKDDNCNQHDGPGDLTFLKMQKEQNRAFSAFTVAELGEILPSTIMYDDCELMLGTCKGINEWITIYYEEESCSPLNFSDINEANARAKMLIHLIENNLMEIPE